MNNLYEQLKDQPLLTKAAVTFAGLTLYSHELKAIPALPELRAGFVAKAMLEYKLANVNRIIATDHWIVEFRSRETGNLFTKGFLGTRQEVEAYHRDIQVELDALLVSVSLDLSE